MLEAYSVLSFLAAHTTRIRLGAMVSPATLRAPVLLIKQVTTLDVLSGGRAWLGLGAGYDTEVERGLGLSAPDVRTRFDVLADTLELAQRMWSGYESPYAGRRTRLDRPIASPPPVSRPHPPVLVGGTGARRTLRLVAELADACNLFDIPDGGRAVRAALDALAGHCADVGRDPGEIERTISTALAPGEPAAEFVARCRALAELGMQHVVVITRGRPWTGDALDTIAAAAGELAEGG
jgi:alkanesulfonate monooxygenase SsuD/methylene tetrahydromethanopterin reductase-like flavin-dependent oxidoreductase (luciferase family)